MRYILTVFICKIFIFVLHLFHHQATSAPGKLAFRLYPDILKEFAKRTKKEIIAVMGTNGKTTTNNLLADCFERAGFEVVCNRHGANMDEGSVVAYINKANLFGKLKCDYACLEMDEGWAEYILNYITPSKIVITNLFRDQLDRYGEIDTTVNFLTKAINKAPNSLLYINADDPITVAMSKDLPNKKEFYGIDSEVIPCKDNSYEGRYCRFCGKELNYKFRHFSQLGNYSCDCGFARPETKIKGLPLSFFPECETDITNVGKVKFPVRGFYNTFNILATVSVALGCGLDKDIIKSAVENFVPEAGRMEKFTIQGKEIYLILAKNPTGFNQSVNEVITDPRKKDVVIAINDGLGDGRDVSWLWDVDFSKLYNENTLSFSCMGTRYPDMALRLKYEGIDTNLIVLSPDTKERIKYLISSENEVIYILANYTALYTVRKSVKEVENELS